MDKSGINIKKNLSEGKGEKSGVSNVDKPECAVCLQVCVQPVQLPCRHIFCYLCVKGVTHQSKRCAMCRQEIPANYLDNPVLVQTPESIMAAESDYEWFYEGRNGWWQYDERTGLEIESAYQKGEKQCEVLIAGFLYVIDFGEWYQYRRSDPFRQRRVKRDLSTIPKKGIAGIRVVSDPVQVQGAHGNVSVRTDQNSPSTAGESLSSEAENTSQSHGELSTQATPDSQNADHTADANTSESTENRTCEVDSAQEVRHTKTRTKRK